MRDEVCRRRNWLRLRLHAEAELNQRGGAAAASTPDAPRPRRRTANRTPARPRAARTPARSCRSPLRSWPAGCAAAAIGAVATRSGASSPEIDSQASPPAELTGRHHHHRNQHDVSVVAVAKGDPQQQRGRQQIENLHQRLRHQPGIAPQQRPFLLPQHARRRAAAESRSTSGAGARPCSRRRRPPWHGRRSGRRTARSRRRARRS